MSEPPLPDAAPISLPPALNLAPFHEDEIILAHPAVVGPFEDVPAINYDPLEAHSGGLLDGMEEDTNVDMYLNLNNVEDIEMSTESAKRKRDKDGEEVSSQAPTG